MKIKDIESLADLLKKHSVGDIIKLKVIRGDITKDISVTLNWLKEYNPSHNLVRGFLLFYINSKSIIKEWFN